MPASHLPIPVEVAARIAADFAKSQVVILAYDPARELTYTTTFGVSPWDKENAAAAGTIATLAVGGDLSKKQTFEDYHQNYDAANYKASRDLNKAALAVLNAFSVGHSTQVAIEKFLQDTEPK